MGCYPGKGKISLAVAEDGGGGIQSTQKVTQGFESLRRREIRRGEGIKKQGIKKVGGGSTAVHLIIWSFGSLFTVFVTLIQ